jgi:hypothetical protein
MPGPGADNGFAMLVAGHCRGYLDVGRTPPQMPAPVQRRGHESRPGDQDLTDTLRLLTDAHGTAVPWRCRLPSR